MNKKCTLCKSKITTKIYKQTMFTTMYRSICSCHCIIDTGIVVLPIEAHRKAFSNYMRRIKIKKVNEKTGDVVKS